MTVLPRRRSDRRLEAGRPVARGRGVQGGVTAAGTGKKRGRRHSRKKAAPSPTTRVNAAAKRKEKAGKGRRSSQSNKAQNQHNKQPLGTGASQSHSNSLPAVKPKAKNSGRDSIANTSGRRGSASSSLPPPKPLARIPPRSPPLPCTSGRKTKSRNSRPQRKRRQRKLPPSGPLKSPPNTSEKNILAAVAARLKAQRKNKLKQDKSSPKSSLSLPHGRVVTQSSQHPSKSLHQQPVTSAYDNLGRSQDAKNKGTRKNNKSLPKATKVKSDHSTAPASPQGPTSSPPPINVNSRYTSTDRPPTVCERYHITDPLNDYRFRTNDYVPEFSVAEEEDFQRRLAECHIFNMTQPDASVKEPRVNVKKQKQKQKKQKQKPKTEGGRIAAGTPSKGKGKGKN